MKDNGGKDILFAGYMLIVIILAIIYFTVPERKDFIDFQVRWWREFIDAVGKFF